MPVIERTPAELLGSLNDVEEKNAPTKLYLYGDESLLQRVPRVSIVGSRKASQGGMERAREYAARLVLEDVVVVSGLAEGIDTAAHETAIEMGGRTIAVLGTGLGSVYPAKNRALQERIAREHLLVSQFPTYAPTKPKYFVMRNRTMALISHATIIVEAGEQSGSLHQGWEALRLGRMLFLDESIVNNGGLQWPAKMMEYGAQKLSLENLEQVIDELPRVTTFADLALQPLLASVEFGALCVYAPKGTTEVSRKAINLTNRIKNADSEILKSAADGVARRAPEEYPDFFGADTTLVPAPRSHPLMAGQLWPGNRIAHAFLKANLGGNVVPLLRRISPVTKAATAIATERPTVQQHLDSIVVDGELAAPGKIIIVDDVITAGRMMFACASLLQDVYPNAEVRAFAVVRTMSGYVEVDPIVQPVVGTITLLGNGNTTRRP